MDIEIRVAGPGDAGEIRAIHLAAFPTALEADLVERLEQDGDVVLSLVAVECASPSTTAFGGGPSAGRPVPRTGLSGAGHRSPADPRTGEELRIVGHVLISRMTAEGDGRNFRAVGLAPVAVIPERQRGGIGGRLIRRALEAMREQEEEMVFLLGEPAYYRRFGFAAETAEPFASPYAGP